MPNSIPEKLWRHISADFIVKLPLVQGYDAILVVCDHLTKMAHFIPTTEKTLVAVWGGRNKRLLCYTDLCQNHKFRHQLCAKEFERR